MSAADFHAHPVPEPVALDMLRMVAPEDHIVFGSDYPHSPASVILRYCQENDIVFFSYMVLEQGALSGKYDTRHPMPEGSDRAATYNPMLGKLEILNAAKAASITLTAVETAELESVADSLELNVIRFWEKEMK